MTESTGTSKENSYRASSSKIYPASFKQSLSQYHNCVLGISLGNNNFRDKKKLEPYIKWISKNFTSCLVLVCDSIYRLTIEVRQGLKEDEAWLEAIKTGKRFVNENSCLFERYSEDCIFEFCKASQIQNTSNFDIYYEQLNLLYRSNESFQRMVNSFADKYLERVKKRLEIEQYDEARQKQLAKTYLLEESAFTACIVKDGWRVVVYPGSLEAFEEISEGLHPEVPEPLKQIILVSLRLRKRNSAIAQ